MLKKLFKQIEWYVLIKMSQFAGIDDYSMSDSWEKDRSVWHNAGNFAEYELKKVSL